MGPKGDMGDDGIEELEEMMGGAGTGNGSGDGDDGAWLVEGLRLDVRGCSENRVER